MLERIPEGDINVRIKFLQRGDDQRDWFIEVKMVPIGEEARRGQEVVTITRRTRPGALTGIDRVYYQNAYPVAAVVYWLYPIRETDQADFAPMRAGRLNCVAQRVVEHFEGALRGKGLTAIRRQKIKGLQRQRSTTEEPQWQMSRIWERSLKEPLS